MTIHIQRFWRISQAWTLNENQYVHLRIWSYTNSYTQTWNSEPNWHAWSKELNQFRIKIGLSYFIRPLIIIWYPYLMLLCFGHRYTGFAKERRMQSQLMGEKLAKEGIILGIMPLHLSLEKSRVNSSYWMYMEKWKPNVYGFGLLVRYTSKGVRNLSHKFIQYSIYNHR